MTTPVRHRRFRKRLLLALLVSAGLHLLILPDLSVPQRSAPPVIQATLMTPDAMRADDDDATGELTVSGQAIQKNDEISSPTAPAVPSPPATPSTPVTAPPPATPSTVATPPRPVTPAAPSTIASTSAVTNTRQSGITPSPSTPAATPATAPVTANTETNAEAETDTKNESSAPKNGPLGDQQAIARYQGEEETFSNPVEQAYYQLLMRHIHRKLPRYPDGLNGQVRLQVTIRYGAVITAVDILNSSGNPSTDEWARRALLATSPVPAVPATLTQPYYFRPTLRFGE